MKTPTAARFQSRSELWFPSLETRVEGAQQHRPHFKPISNQSEPYKWGLFRSSRWLWDACGHPEASGVIFPLMPGVVFVRLGLISTDEVKLTATETLQLPDWIKVCRRDGDTIQSSPQKNSYLWGKALVPDRRCFIGGRKDPITAISSGERRRCCITHASAASICLGTQGHYREITVRWRRCFGTRHCCPSARSVTLQRAAQMLFRRVSSCWFLEVNSR